MDLAQGEKNHDRSYPENGDREMLNDYTRQKLINEPTNDCNDKSYDRRQFSRQSLYSKSSFHSLYGDYSGVSNIKMCQKMCPKKYDVRCNTVGRVSVLNLYVQHKCYIIYVYINRRAIVNFLLLHQHNRRRNLIRPKMALRGTGQKTQILKFFMLYQSFPGLTFSRTSTTCCQRKSEFSNGPG